MKGSTSPEGGTRAATRTGNGLRRDLASALVCTIAAAALSAGLAPTPSPPPSSHSHAPAIGPTSAFFSSPGPASSDPTGRLGAGGPAIAHRSEARRVRSAAARKRAPHARVFYTGTLAAEPTLGVDARGRIFFVGLDTSTGLPQWPVLRSGDGGRSWKDVSPRLGDGHRHPTGQDPMLYVDKDTGRVFSADFAGPCTPVSASDDAGKTWTTGAACGLADHQNLFTGPPAISETVGYENVVYYCAIDGGAFQETSTKTGCLKSLDGGISFVRTGSPPYVNGINPAMGNYGIPGHCSGVTGHGFVDRRGTVYVPRGWCGQPWLAISHDEGATWTRVQVARNGMPAQAGGPQDYQPDTADGYQEHEAGVAVDRKGTIYYTWTAKNRLPYLAVSRDGGESWSKPLMIARPGLREASLPAIDIGGRGKIAIAYIGSTNAPGGRAPDGVGDEYAGVTWNGYVTVTGAAHRRDPVFYSASINEEKDPLVVGECGILRCQQQYDFIDVVVDRKGRVWSSMVDGCTGMSCSPRGVGIVGRVGGGLKLR